MNRNKKVYTKNYETYTDKLTKEQISDMLKYYKKIDIEELENLNIGTHLRYFSVINGEKKFRLGGMLLNKENLPIYIKLKGATEFSVQVENCIFFRKMSEDEIRQEAIEQTEKHYKKIIDEQNDLIKKLKKEIDKYNKFNKK
jgi:hypothetical protein